MTATVKIGETFVTDSNEYTVLEVNGRTARVKPRFRHLSKKEGGPKTVPVFEAEFHVNVLNDMDRK